MAYVLSSVSGNLISAASAGYAPTNSGDVSAIASSYQVVSATATQLYAGTAYVTSINDAPISASRAGNAANASMATSAYYDGTGRLISALPDSAAVSAIASAYAESATSGKQDTLTFGYDAEDKISSIDGSALAGEDGTTYVSPSGTVWISGSSIEATDSAYLPSKEDTTLVYYSDSFTGVYTGSNVYTATGANLIYASGLFLSGTLSALDSNNVLAAVSSYSGETDVRFSASAEQGPLKLQSDSFWNMHYISAYTAYIKPASVVPLAHASALPTYQYNAENKISSINGSSLAGGVDSATCSAIASAYAESAASSKQDTLTFGYNTSSQISSIDGSALAGGGIKVSPSGTLWISGESAESTDSAFIPGVATETFVQSSNSPTIFITPGSPLTVAGANKITISNGSWYYATLYVSGNGTLVSSITSTGQQGWPQTFTAEAPISIGTDNFIGVDEYSAFSAVTSPDQVVPLAHASALPTYQYNTASAISGINGSALAAGSTYSAGEGIDITDDVISVEAPVDIVAGPGIVIDNPDGNTLRVSQSTFGAWENITDQFTWESNATDNGVRCLYNSTLKLLWMQGYVHLNVGTSSTKVCTLPSSMKTQLRIIELGMPSTLEEKHGLLSTNNDRTELHFKWITVPSNKYVGFFLICPMEEV